MNKMFKDRAGFSTLAIIIAAVVVAAILATVFILRSTKKEPIKIGAILSLSGPASHLVCIRDSMLLAVDEINAWGGVNGRKIELIIEDSKTSPEEGKKAFSRIEAAHHPLLYVSTNSSVSMALAPLAEENRVVLVGLVVTTPKLAKQNEWVFRYYSSAEGEVPPILSILQKLRLKNLGILYLNDAYGTSVYKLLKKEFERNGGTARSEAFEPKESDLKEQIANLKDMRAIYTVGFPSNLKTVYKQLKEENFSEIMLGCSSTIILDITAPEVNGMYVAAPIIYNPNLVFAKEAKEKYEARYNNRFNHQAANGYDFVKFLASLLEDKDISRKSVKSLLEEGFIYSGVFGSIDVKVGEHDILFPLHPARIVDGKVKYLR